MNENTCKNIVIMNMYVYNKRFWPAGQKRLLYSLKKV